MSFRDIKSWVAGVRDDKEEETAFGDSEPQAAQGGVEEESAAGEQAQLLEERPEGKPRGIFFCKCWRWCVLCVASILRLQVY